MSRYAGATGSFALDLAKFAQQAQDAIDETLQEVVIEVAGSLIRMSPVDTGRFRGNWMLSISAPNNSTTASVDPTGEATLRQIVAEAGAFTAGQVAYITNGLEYSIPLEYGHSSQAPSGMVRVTLTRFQQILSEAARKNQV